MTTERNFEKPVLIEVEGSCDGSGKSTALEVLYDELTAKGLKVLKMREVGNSHDPNAVKLREIILNPDTVINGKAMEMIFAAMRLMNGDFLKSVAGQYDVVLNDRGYIQHLAYCDHNTDVAFTSDLYQMFLEGYSHMPDLVVFMKVSPETSLARRKHRNEKNGITKVDVIEAKGHEFQVKVSESFDKYIKQYEGIINVIQVNGEGTKEEVIERLKPVADEIYVTFGEPQPETEAAGA